MVERSASMDRELVAGSASARGLALAERRLLLAGLDSLAVALAYVAAYNIWSARVTGEGLYVPGAGCAVVVLLWLLSGRLTGVYDLRIATKLRSGARTILATLACSWLGLLAVFVAAPFRLINRPTMLIWPLTAGLAVIGGRILARRVLASSDLAIRLVLVCRSDVLEKVWPAVAKEMGSLYRLRAVVDADQPDCLSLLASMAAGGSTDQVVVGVRDNVSHDLFRALLSCHEQGIVVRSLADVYEELTGRMLLDQLGHTWLMSLPMLGETSQLYSAFKRALDIAGALAALTVLAALMPILAPILYLEGRSVFYRQSRVGKFGTGFSLIKLRTMKRVPEGQPRWTAEGDSRITTIGRMLRRFHVDELPQALNILRGNMSIIGPRPEQPHYVQSLRESIGFYNSRLTLRPGLTGWAQVNAGYLGGVEGAREKLSYDLYYIKHQSVTLDLLILARTALTVLTVAGR